MKKTFKLSTLTLICALLTQVAHAGLFDDDEARARVNALRKDLDARIVQIEDASRAQLQLNTQIEQLKDEIAKLRGQIELLGNDIDQAQRRQKDFYIDLDTRLRKIESNATATTSTTAPESTTSAPVATDLAKESRDYDSAVSLLRSAKYADSASAFKAFIKNYPQSKSQASAHFWVASSYFQLRDMNTAQEYYTKVITNWPTDPLAPDALLGVANCQQAKNDTKGARTTLEGILAKYPTSEAAKTARARLK